MTASELLRQDKDLCGWWVSVAHDDRFDRVIALSRAKLSESAIDQQQMKGANQFILTLRTITDNEDELNEFPTPGLVHDLAPKIKPKEKPKKE